MKSLIEATIIAAIVSIATSFIARAAFPREKSSRYAGVLGLAAGYVAAFYRLEPTHLVPSTSWDWLAWLVVAAAIIGPISVASGVATVERWALTAVFALAAAWVLVPARTSPFRANYTVIFAGSLTLWCSLLDCVTTPKNILAITGAIVVSALSGAALVAYGASIKIGGLAGVGAAGLAGCILLVVWSREVTLIRGLLAAHSVILGGVLLNGYLYDMAWPPLLLVSVSPLTLCLFEVGPLARLNGGPGHLAKAFLVALPQIGAWYLVMAK